MMVNLGLGKQGLPIVLVEIEDYERWFQTQSEFTANWLMHSGFKAPGFSLIPGPSGNPMQVLVVVETIDSVWNLSDVAVKLPDGQYYVEGFSRLQARFALGWALAQYQFSRYLSERKSLPSLSISDSSALLSAQQMTEAIYLVRDMVNTPAIDMMPQHISSLMRGLSQQYGADFHEIIGDDLLKQNYPTVHMVGRASIHSPRLLELTWGDTTHPKLVLVGKGVCFDSGGLDLKPAAGMRLMKKDMGGAAHVLGLAKLIMAQKLPVQLRVLVPAVENAVSNNAFRPGDIVKTRSGLTVEIDNTDAEGRLVLCDALAEASTETPDLIIDFATLTGAARVALGLEVPGFFSTDAEFTELMMSSSTECEDAIWPLPLHQGYASFMKGSISDLVNSSASPFGGSITAALFLKAFVGSTPWVHFDVGAWNDRDRPGRPKGGEAMGVRAVFNALEKRYGSANS